LERPHGSSSAQQAQFQSSNHHVWPWCTQALAFTELPVDNVNRQGFNVSPAVHHFVRNSLWKKNAGSRKRSHFSLFERVLTVCHVSSQLNVQLTNPLQ
jgi:hypothetical protein